MKLSFILLFIFYSLCQFNNPQNMGVDSNGNKKIGNSASGLPIFQTTTGSVLYPIPSSDNNNAVEWVEMNDFLSGSIIVGVDDNKMPIFKLNNGDIAYLTIKPQDLTNIKLNNNIVPLENNEINKQINNQINYAPPVLSLEEKQEKFEKELEEHFKTINITRGIRLSDLCYVPFGRGTCAPHFIISGAMKSGTTSLFSYLLNHPNILPLTDNPRLNGKPVLAEKEIRYFNDPTFSQMLSNFGARGSFEQYLNVFKPIQPSSMMITGESSPMYICQPFVATRINLMLPYVKNIILLRNPIDRMYSEHWFKYSLGNVQMDLEEQYLNFKECAQREINMYKHCGIFNLTYPVSKQERNFIDVCHTSLLRILSRMDPKDPRCNNEYKGLCLPASGLRSGCSDLGIKNSIYYFQLIEWIEQFSDDRLLIIPSEQFYDNPSEIVENVTEFLGLTEIINFDWSFIGDKAYNIINPKLTQNNMQPLGTNTLSIGQGDSSTLSEKYPPMEEELRRELEDFFSLFNHFLAKLLKRPNFWDY